jgi:hypothetical protein
MQGMCTGYFRERQYMKILIKRDTIDSFTTTQFIPREYELIAAYNEETKQVIYKLGDGTTPWPKLKEITKISELDKFVLYSSSICDLSNPTRKSGHIKCGPEVYLNPFLINELIGTPEAAEAMRNNRTKVLLEKAEKTLAEAGCNLLKIKS